MSQCPKCCRDAVPSKEPLLLTQLPDYQKASTDLLELHTYLLVVNYHSRISEVVQLRSTTLQSVINVLKATFANQDISETLISDKDSRLSLLSYGFVHTYYQQQPPLPPEQWPCWEGNEDCKTMVWTITCRVVPGQVPPIWCSGDKGELSPTLATHKGFCWLDEKFKQKQKQNILKDGTSNQDGKPAPLLIPIVQHPPCVLFTGGQLCLSLM